MKALLQRVKNASVSVEGKKISEIGPGLLVFLGVMKEDTQSVSDLLAEKICQLRIFQYTDPETKKEKHFEKSLLEAGKELLVVSQFTLCGSCTNGRRPSFDDAMPPSAALSLYEYFVSALRKKMTVSGQPLRVAEGQFQAYMDVELVNDGPVTFLIDTALVSIGL